MQTPKILSEFQTKILKLKIDELISDNYYNFGKVQEISQLIPIIDYEYFYDFKLLNNSYFANMEKDFKIECLTKTLEMFKDDDRQFLNKILDNKIKEIT